MEQKTEQTETHLLSGEEQKLIAPFVTNLEKRVFCLRNLPEVVKGALFSRYSRSTKSLRRILLDEFINVPEMGFKEIVGERADAGNEIVAIKKAEEFYDRVLVGYGDDSVAELGGAHIACEDVSIVASKVLEDSRIGLSPLEKSTRYVYFDEKVGEKYKYFREPKIMESGLAALYQKTCDKLFDVYSKTVPPLTQYVCERFPQQEGVSDRAYKSTVRAKVCDVLRGLLPASTLTNVGIFGNGRAFEYLLAKMYASDLTEIKVLAASMHEELGKVIPSFVKRANDKYGLQQQEYWRASAESASSLAKQITRSTPDFSNNHLARSVELVDCEPEESALEKICSAILHQYSQIGLTKIRQIISGMNEGERRELVRAYVGTRGNRRNKPGRAFETVQYTFDLVGNFGMYRDLHRHRILTQQRQAFGVSLGYDVPPELVEAGFGGEFDECMQQAREAFKQIHYELPLEAQYAVPLAYRIRWSVTLNLRAAFHLIELRSMPQGHRDYRKMVQQIYYEIKRMHPFLAEFMNFVDLRDYPFLERLESEKKIDKKIEEIEKKYGQ